LKISEIRIMSDAELKKQLEDAHQELFNLRFRAATRQLANHREIPKVKKKIARLNTIVKERELGIGLTNGNEKKS
jgi:large subunit ribosomal protein L29